MLGTARVEVLTVLVCGLGVERAVGLEVPPRPGKGNGAGLGGGLRALQHSIAILTSASCFVLGR